MRNLCKRCGEAFDAKSEKTMYCDECRQRARTERSMEKAEGGNWTLAEERLRRGMTAKEMAAYLGVSVYTYYEAERYGKAPGIKSRRLIAEKLAIPAEELFGELVYYRVCRSCHAAYKTDEASSKLCLECREAQNPARERRKRRTVISIPEVVAAARAAGMSYGQYVSYMEVQHE